jgi:predicted nucleic acid-binding protein
MERIVSVVREFFIDSSYAIALGSPRDQHHADAVRLARQIQTERVRLVTTRAVILEIGNALARSRHRAAGVALLQALETDPGIEIVPLSEDLYHAAAQLYRKHADKERGLTDCLSFVVMAKRGLTEALTADDHFRQAGFQALLTSP